MRSDIADKPVPPGLVRAAERSAIRSASMTAGEFHAQAPAYMSIR